MILQASPGSFWRQVADQLLYADVLTKAPDILILLAATVLVYRTFRERYLLAWLAGWVAYLVYRLFGTLPAIRMMPEAVLLSQLAYVVAVTFFALSVLQYIRQRRWRSVLLGLSLLAMIAVALRMEWSDSEFLAWTEILSSSAILWITAVQLAIFAPGRKHFGAWVMVPMLCVLHLDAHPAHPHAYVALDVAIELLLGLSMLVIVLDHSRERTERLSLVNRITGMVSTTHEAGPLVLSALEELRKHIGAKSAWYRYLLQDKLLIQQQIGLSEEYLSARRVLSMDETDSSKLIAGGSPGTILPAQSDRATATLFANMKVKEVLVIPVRGKSSVTGSINLGLPRRRFFLPEELNFLASVGDQLGIALESLHMFEQVMRSQRQWVSTFDSIEDIIIVHDDAGRIMRTNRALLARLEKNVSEVIHQPLGAVLPNVPPGVACPYCHGPLERYREGPDASFGGHSLVSTSTYSEGGASGLGTIHIVKDTTERRAAEERYRLLFEEVGEGLYITTGDGRLLEVNDALVRMLGYDSRRELLNTDLGAKVYQEPEDRLKIQAEIQAKNFVRNFETNLLRKDGRVVTVLESSFGSRDASGRVVRYHGFLVDISEQKRVENEIKRRNRELNALNAIAVIGAQSFDLDEILNVTLRQVADLFNAEMGSVWMADPDNFKLHVRALVGSGSLGGRVSEITVPKENWKAIVDKQPEFLTAEHVALLPAEVRTHFQQLGTQRSVWVLLWLSGRPLGVLGLGTRTAQEYSAMDRNLMVAIARQLATTIDKVRLYEETTKAYDDLQRTQEQLLQSEKMSAVGQLISGVAHELNNPLTAIVGYAQLLEQEPLSVRALDFVQKLYRQTQRTRRVVQNLLSFARQRKPLKQDLDLRRVLDEALALRDYDLKLNNIQVERVFSETFPHVVADAHQLEQVFLNIINNAVDAMLEGGKAGVLRVTTSIDQEREAALVEFHDSGPGIKEPKRIFDPFYTTKVVGKGTGLGLSICYGIVKEHGGDISAFNHPGGGAVFQIRLPLTSKVRQTEVMAPVISSEALSGRVLAVDDEEAVLELEKELLAGAGAEVTIAANGAEAVRILETETFDAVVIDSKMPGEYDGPEVYRWVLQHHPEMAARFVFTVSHATEPTVRKFLEEYSITHLEKPFQVSELLTVLRRILAQRKAEAVRGAS